MSRICDHFDEYFELWHQDIYRLFFTMTGHPKTSAELTFQAFLRLGAAQDKDGIKIDRKKLLFQSALSLCDDYYLRRIHRLPKRKVLEEANISFSISDELWAMLHLPLKKRAAISLISAGFTPEEAASMTGKKPITPIYMEQLAAVCLDEDEAALILDRIYERFSERSVGVENRLHAIRLGFDRAAPWLALGVLVIFGIAVVVSLKMAGQI